MNLSTIKKYSFALLNFLLLLISSFFANSSVYANPLTPSSFVAVGRYINQGINPLIISSIDNGDTWQVRDTSSVNINNEFSSVDCHHNICVASGISSILAVSKDYGITWQPKVIADVDSSTITPIYEVSCSGDGKNSMCVAAGEIWPINAAGGFLVVSNDGGETWLPFNISMIQKQISKFTSVSCVGNDESDSLCVAAGTSKVEGDTSPPGLPTLAISTDRGKSWQFTNIGNLPNRGIFNKVSCTGKGKKAICAAVGKYVDNYSNNLSFWTQIASISLDGGAHWRFNYFHYGSMNNLYDVQCTGDESDNRCIAVGIFSFFPGSDGSDYLRPVIMVSNNGKDWQAKQISNLTTVTEGIATVLTKVSCTNEGSKSLCMIPVWVDSLSKYYMAVSTDGGDTWNLKPFANIGLQDHNSFASIKCQKFNKKALCAVTVKSFDGALTLAVSSDAGNTWQVKPIEGASAAGQELSVKSIGGAVG